MGQDISLKVNGKTHDLNHDLTFSARTINCVCHSIRSMFRVLGIYNFGWSKNYEVSVNLPLRGTMERKSRKKPSTYNKILIKVLLLKIFCEIFRFQNMCKLCKSVTYTSSREYKCCKCLIF